MIRSTTSLCIYGLLYHLLYVYLYDRWFPEPRARVKAGYRTCPNNVALPSCPHLASNGIVDCTPIEARQNNPPRNYYSQSRAERNFTRAMGSPCRLAMLGLRVFCLD
jgi:hypothetical protein